MAEPVKGRSYDNSGRAAKVRATKRQVVAAAHRAFEDDGYVATTIAGIATASGVPAPTIYRLFGSKPAILSAVLDVSYVGDDEPLAFHERPAVLAAFAEPDPRRMLEAFARIARQVKERSGRLQHMVGVAAAADPDAAELDATIRRQRHIGHSRVARELARRGVLAEGLSEKDAADTIYTLMGADVGYILTVERRWSGDRYERWLARSLCAVLLDSRPPGEA